MLDAKDDAIVSIELPETRGEVLAHAIVERRPCVPLMRDGS